MFYRNFYLEFSDTSENAKNMLRKFLRQFTSNIEINVVKSYNVNSPQEVREYLLATVNVSNATQEKIQKFLF